MEEEEGSPYRASLIAGVVVVALAVGAVATFLTRSQRDDSPSPRPAEAEAGTSCLALQGAAAAFDEGDLVAAESLIREARKQAVQALDQDGVLFGRPEKLALQLAAQVKNLSGKDGGEKLRMGLQMAVDACEDLKAT